MTSVPLVRLLGATDHAASLRLGTEAFGPPPGTVAVPVDAPPAPPPPRPGRHVWGAFVDDRLAARWAVHEYDAWFRGRRVPLAGVASVAVAPEDRGSGLLRAVAQAGLDQAVAERGATFSTLFPTAPGIYRSLGYEVVGELRREAVPALALASVRPPSRTRLVRAGGLSGDIDADLGGARAAYEAWARGRTAALSRTGPRFTGDEDPFTEGEITLAVEGEAVVGYARWVRGPGYRLDGVLEVHDLVAATADAACALWRLLASWSSVVDEVVVTTSGDDPAWRVLPTLHRRTVGRHPLMLRVLDLPTAVAALALPADRVPGPVDLRVAGDRLGGAVGRLDGTWRLADDGTGLLAATPLADGGDGGDGGDLPTLDPRGLALLLPGAARCEDVRASGLLDGPDHHDDVLDALLRDRPVATIDYF